MQNKHHFFYFSVPTSWEGVGVSTRLVQSTKFCQTKKLGAPLSYLTQLKIQAFLEEVQKTEKN